MVRRRPGSGARRPEAADVTMERSATADIAKTIGIILVVIGHYNPADAPEWYHLANRFIYAFHMPLFMFASGYIYAMTGNSQNKGGGKLHFEEIQKVEDLVNDKIMEVDTVETKLMTIEEAKESGATALFDEKYGDVVRVVNIGDYSIELCGGCHVSNSSEIGLFKIVSEESVGSGIRRIVAQSGLAAYNAMVHEKETVDTIASTLNLKNRKDVINKVEALKEDLKEAKAEIEQLSAKLNAIQAASKANDIEEINGVKVLYVEEQLENAKAKQLTFDFRDQLESGIVVLVSKYEEKCSYFVSVSKDLVGQYKAGNIIKAINEVVDGRGGGKPDFAQGGCAINDNISKIKGALKNIL